MKNKALTSGYLSSFSMELYLVLQAGISLDEGMEILYQGEENPQTKQTLADVANTLADGYDLCTALKQTDQFPSYMVDMIGIGEQTGNLDRCLKGLSTYYDRQEQLSQNVRRAVLNPIVLLTMLTAVLVVLIVEVLPMFNDVYAQLGGTLDGMGAVILDFGTLLRTNWVLALVIVAVVIGCAIAVAVRGQKDGKRVLMSTKLGWAVATSKLASALAMAMQSGLDMDTAMEMAESLTQHPELRRKIATCRSRMAEGAGFAEVIGAENLFPSLYCRMLGVGVRTGAMDEVMDDIARRQDTAAQDAIDRHIASVEPTLVMVMSVLVGLVLLSVMLPLASIMTSLG